MDISAGIRTAQKKLEKAEKRLINSSRSSSNVTGVLELLHLMQEYFEAYADEKDWSDNTTKRYVSGIKLMLMSTPEDSALNEDEVEIAEKKRSCSGLCRDEMKEYRRECVAMSGWLESGLCITEAAGVYGVCLADCLIPG
jgi:ribosome-binding ATPase YchF (GTP1/OBG family)